MFSRSFSFTAAARALLVLSAVGLLLGPAGFGADDQSAQAALFNEVKKLLASDAQSGDGFGFRVAISGNTAIVGAAGNSAGAAYVLQRDQGGVGNWGQVKKLTASDAKPGDLFGLSVAISGDTAVVGAFQRDTGVVGDAGAAYVFQRDQGGAGNWGQVKKLTATDAQAGDLFGQGAAVSGDTAVVGAPNEGTGGFLAGAAYVSQLAPVGGIAELPDVDAAPPGTDGTGGYRVGVLAGVAAAIVASATALAGAAWYARKRWAKR